MTVIDPNTDLGKLRLRCADWGDLVFLPDAVYIQTLADNSNNLPATAKICATYILGMLSFKTRRRLNQLEVYNNQFSQYRDYLLMITKDPTFMTVSPVPYVSEGRNVIQEFANEWNQNYYSGTQSQAMALSADLSTNDGSRTGPYGQFGSGWNVP